LVLAALPFGAGVDVARDLHAALEGKVLLDCSNPVGPGFRLLTE
jgi:predicted dinucleotide-binding enzyme